MIRDLLCIRGIPEKIFQQIVTVACFKNQSPETLKKVKKSLKQSALENLANFPGRYLC